MGETEETVKLADVERVFVSLSNHPLDYAQKTLVGAALQAVRALPRQDGLREAGKALLEQWDAFEASHGTQEEAYYKLAKYARKHWDALRAALAESEKP